MGNRRLKNKSYSEYKRHKRRESRRLTQKRTKSRTEKRDIPLGYLEIDRVVVGYIREYMKSINPRQIFSTIDDTVPMFKRQVALLMHGQHCRDAKIVIPFINYSNDTVLMEINVVRQTSLFRHQFSNPSFFQKLLLFLDRTNLYYWCRGTTAWQVGSIFDHLDKLNEPILQRLVRIARIPYTTEDIESGKVRIGCSVITIRDGNILTNSRPIATLSQAVLDQYGVASKIREALAHV